ncbi:MAG: diacylglycerol kinase [Thiomonas sp.]
MAQKREGLRGAAQDAASPNPYKTRTGLSRIVHAGINSASGMRAAWHTESAFRQEVGLAVVLLPLAFWLGRSWTERAVLAGTVLLVLIVELLNTAIEYTVDRVSLEQHALSKTAKDLGSAAVLLTLLLCVLIWGAVLLSRWV